MVPLVFGILLAVGGAIAIAVLARDPATEAVRDLTEPHAAAAATLTFALALLPLWLSAAYVFYRGRRRPTRHSVPFIGTIVASGVVSLIFLGPKRSSGRDSYEQAIAEHGGSVANAIAMGGDAAAFVGVAVLPALFVAALISQRRATTPSDERFGQIAVCVLVILAMVVLALMLTSGELSAPLTPESTR